MKHRIGHIRNIWLMILIFFFSNGANELYKRSC